jgi:hypothetical protein
MEEYSREHGLRQVVDSGQPFRHTVIRNQQPLIGTSLHVYLEGDGSPYENPSTVAADPTPRLPLMLHLMSLDMQRSVYVGRPCYQEQRRDDNCGPQYWTSRRFSPEVVASLAVVIRSEMAFAGASSVQLFGHSGGGALVVLLTRELPVERVVTLAGNLDTAAWARLHGYTPLAGSLNPVEVTLPPQLASRTEHLVGENDEVVPPDMVRNAAGRIGGQVRVVPGYSHQCCWETLWPRILAYPATGTNKNSPFICPASGNME